MTTSLALTELFVQYEWSDMWADANMAEAVRYARGSKLLRMPEEWRRVWPSELLCENAGD